MLSNVNFEKISDSGRLHNTVVLLATSLCAPYGVGDPEDAGQQAGELDEDILVNVQGQQELQGLDLCTPPPAHLHHETYYSGEKFNQKQTKIRKKCRLILCEIQCNVGIIFPWWGRVCAVTSQGAFLKKEEEPVTNVLIIFSNRYL